MRKYRNFITFKKGLKAKYQIIIVDLIQSEDQKI